MGSWPGCRDVHGATTAISVGNKPPIVQQSLQTKSCLDEFLSILVAKGYCTRAAPNEEVAALSFIQSLPSQVHRLRASLTAHETHGLAVDDLRFGIDTSPGAVTEAVTDNLRQVAHELVVAL